jgi:uncharacterized membrane protein
MGECRHSPNFHQETSMITLKGVLFGIGLSVVGTIVYLVFLVWDAFRMPVPAETTGAVGLDIISLFYYNAFHAPIYWIFVLGLILTGIGIVGLIPRPVVLP